jgi:hypothetical protein
MSDKQDLIQSELEEVKIQMTQNVNQTVENIVRLEELNAKTESIFELSSKLKNRPWDKECVQIWVCSALFIIIIIISLLFLLTQR